MKTSKIKLKVRNCFVVLALNRKAGAHYKTHKQLRSKLNRDWGVT